MKTRAKKPGLSGLCQMEVKFWPDKKDGYRWMISTLSPDHYVAQKKYPKLTF